MAQAKHIGKVVVTQDAVQGAGLPARPDRSYLITGGLTGLGLVTARWLVERGARHLVLVGRRAPSEGAKESLAELEQRGARVLVMRADVSEPEAVRSVLSQIAATLPPLAGIVHSAGVLDDGVLLQQDWSRFEKVLAPKVRGHGRSTSRRGASPSTSSSSTLRSPRYWARRGRGTTRRPTPFWTRLPITAGLRALPPRV